MFDIYVTYSPDPIRDTIGWADKVTTNDLVQAIMVLCNSVERLERQIERLDDIAYAPSGLTSGSTLTGGSSPVECDADNQSPVVTPAGR